MENLGFSLLAPQIFKNHLVMENLCFLSTYLPVEKNIPMVVPQGKFFGSTPAKTPKKSKTLETLEKVLQVCAPTEEDQTIVFI